MIHAPSTAFTSAFTADQSSQFRARSGASWGAILAGAMVAVSLSLLLLILGVGLGFSSVSAWPERGLSAGAFTVAGTIWLIVTQWVSACAGGYITGRLRHRWLATHVHEVFFRDTAHGLVTWALATLIVAAVLASSTAALLGASTHAAGALTAAGGRDGAAMGLAGAIPRGSGGEGSLAAGTAYDLDKLFRGATPGVNLGGVTVGSAVPAGAAAPAGSGTPGVAVAGTGRAAVAPSGDAARGEVMHIAAKAVIEGSVSDADRAYVAGLVAGETGITTEEARQRFDAFLQALNDAGAKARAEAEAARKAAADAALYTALALLIGAFIASVSAAIGGRVRDAHA
jgi:hypothetical protein